MTPRLEIFTGDCRHVLPERVSNESVDLVVTSPPYDKIRTYGGKIPTFNFEAFKEVAREIERVLKPGGVCCWNVSDQCVDGSETLTSFRQGLWFLDACKLKMHDRMIYEKLNFSHPEKTRYHQVFEDVFILSKGSPKTFNPIKDKKNSTAGCVGNLGVNTFTEANGSKSVRAKKVTAEFGMRGNVWKGKTRGQEDMCESMAHPAMMPKWLARDLIISWSNVGDIVLDPMAGSGTTGKMANEFGRHAILIDANPDYESIIESQTSQPGLML